MTQQFQNVAQNASTNRSGKKNPPTHVAKTRTGSGQNASFERVGAAWLNEDGSFYIKLYGTQVVSAISLYPLNTEGPDEAA